MKLWLLVDSTYLCWRAYHTTGGLKHGGLATGVSFGVLRDIETLIDLFDPSCVIWAFDGGGPGLRGQLYSGYKASRQDLTEEEREQRKEFYAEVDRLKTQHLPDVGFKNIFTVRGYEADDIIAHVAQNLPPNTEAAIVTADGDLLQCLSDRVFYFNPTTKKTTTIRSFKEKYGIVPSMWASVKALAGCSTDDVPGIKGVGEVTAAKWFAGTLKPDTKAYKSISEHIDVYEKNMPLVQLPYPGIEVPEIKEDEYEFEKLLKVRADLGIRTKRTPISQGFDV